MDSGLVGEFASDPTLVPISLPIDYWDYLGWKDTLADPRNTARQRAYAKMRGDLLQDFPYRLEPPRCAVFSTSSFLPSSPSPRRSRIRKKKLAKSKAYICSPTIRR